MIQQSEFWIYIQKNWKQGLEKVFVYPLFIIIHESQDMEAT